MNGAYTVLVDRDGTGFTDPTTESGAVPRVAGQFGNFDAARVEEGTTNLFTNPSFETGVAIVGNLGGGVRSQSSDQAYSGTYSLKCVALASSDGWQQTSATAVAAATPHTCSALLYGTAGETVTFQANEYDGGGVYLGLAHSTNAVFSSTGWQRVTVTFTTNASCAQVLLFAYSASGAQTFYTDAIQIEAKSYATTYCDGSLGTGYAWSGTAHASSSSRTVASLAFDDAALPAGADARSIMLWLTPLNLSNDNAPLFSYGTAAFKQGILFSTGSGADKAKLLVGFYGANAAVSTGSLTVDTPTTAAVTIAADGTITYYVGGVAAGTSSMAAINTAAGGAAKIGAAIAGWGSSTIGNVLVDAVAVFDRVLDAAEVAELDALTRPPIPGEVAGQDMTTLFIGADAFVTPCGSRVVNPDALPKPGLIWTRGQDKIRQLAPPKAGSLDVLLNNRDGAYSPGSTVAKGRQIRIYEADATQHYYGFTGILDLPKQQGGPFEERTQLHALGTLSRLAGKRQGVTTELYSSISTDEAIGYVLDAIGWPAADRVLDVGETVLDWWWLDDADAFAALRELLNTEGPGARLYEDGQGRIVFKSRHAAVTETRSTTVQDTYGGSADLPIVEPWAYDETLLNVINACTVTVKQRSAAALAVVWTLNETITLGPDETRTVYAVADNRDPMTAAVTPSSGGGDYTVASGSLASVTLGRTSGATIPITLTAGGAGASVTGLRLRAQAVSVVSTSAIPNRVDASTSIAAYGTQPFELPVRAEIPSATAQDFADAVVGYYQDGRPTLTFSVPADDSDSITSVLAREIGDRVRVRVARVDLDSEFVILQRKDSWDGGLHLATFGAEDAAGSPDYLVWGSGTWGSSVWGF